MRGYLAIVSVAARGSTGLYVRRDSGDWIGSRLSGAGVQGTGCATTTTSRQTCRGHVAAAAGCQHDAVIYGCDVIARTVISP